MRSAYDLVLFDLDGTLTDPLEGVGRSINYALHHHGYETIELSQLAQYIGPPLDESFKAIVGSSHQSDIDALVAKYRERYSDVGFSENVLYPGVPAALARLGRAGIPMGVCTSKRRDFAERILKMFGIVDFFCFVDGGEIGTHKWQQIATLRAQGLVTSASLMVGDRAVDLRAAHKNGLRAGGVLWGYGSLAELEPERPHHLFRSPSEWSLLEGRIGPCSALPLPS